VSIKLRQDLPGSGINSTRLQKILGVEFGVALEIWSNKCRVGQSANLAILNIWGKAVKDCIRLIPKGKEASIIIWVCF
jgi:hypothetical protein